MNTTSSTSDTPRTDAKAVTHPWVNGESQYVAVEFARELERENAKLRKDKERLDWWNGERDYQFGNSHKMVNPGWWWNYGKLQGKAGIPNIRDTIDSAMAHSKSGRNKYGVIQDPTGPLIHRISDSAYQQEDQP